MFVFIFLLSDFRVVVKDFLFFIPLLLNIHPSHHSADFTSVIREGDAPEHDVYSFVCCFGPEHLLA